MGSLRVKVPHIVKHKRESQVPGAMILQVLWETKTHETNPFRTNWYEFQYSRVSSNLTA